MESMDEVPLVEEHETPSQTHHRSNLQRFQNIHYPKKLLLAAIAIVLIAAALVIILWQVLEPDDNITVSGKCPSNPKHTKQMFEKNPTRNPGPWCTQDIGTCCTRFGFHIVKFSAAYDRECQSLLDMYSCAMCSPEAGRFTNATNQHHIAIVICENTCRAIYMACYPASDLAGNSSIPHYNITAPPLSPEQIIEFCEQAATFGPYRSVVANGTAPCWDVDTVETFDTSVAVNSSTLSSVAVFCMIAIIIALHGVS